MGIAQDDAAGRTVASNRNYAFFGAPMVGILCMHRDLGLSLGYADPDFPTNHLRAPKQPVAENVLILAE